MTRIPKPKEVVKVYDNKGVSFDRYTVVVRGEPWFALGLSENCDSPQGFSQVVDVPYPDFPHGTIKWGDLPENVQKHVVRRLNSQ